MFKTMSTSRKTLFVISWVMIVAAVVGVVFGLMDLTGAFDWDQALNAEAVHRTQAVGLSLGVVIIISGMIELVLGFLGLLSSKEPKYIRWYSIPVDIIFFLEFIGLIVSFATNSLSSSSWNVIFTGIAGLAGWLVRKEYYENRMAEA